MNITDPTKSDFAGPCPRCGGAVPGKLSPGEYPGALSRLDNKTYICSACGSEEAMFNWMHPGATLPPVNERVSI